MQLRHRSSEVLRVEPFERDAFVEREELLESSSVVPPGPGTEPPLLRQLIEKLPEQLAAGVVLLRHERRRDQRNLATAALASSPSRPR